MHRSLSALLLATAVLGGTAVACSDDGESPEEIVCADAAALKESVATFVDDVKDGNFGVARDQAGEVRTAFDELRSSLGDLAASDQTPIKGSIDAVEATVGELSEARRIGEIRDLLSTLGTQIEAVSTSVRETLSC